MKNNAKAWNFSRLRSHIFYTTKFHAFFVFSLCFLNSLKVQQKHNIFVVSGFILFTQPSFKLFPCFLLHKKYETLHAKGTSKAWNYCRVRSGTFYTTKFHAISVFFVVLKVWNFTRKRYIKSIKLLSCLVSYFLQNKKTDSSFILLRYATKMFIRV
jgi:hypothetical protein